MERSCRVGVLDSEVPLLFSAGSHTPWILLWAGKPGGGSCAELGSRKKGRVHCPCMAGVRNRLGASHCCCPRCASNPSHALGRGGCGAGILGKVDVALLGGAGCTAPTPAEPAAACWWCLYGVFNSSLKRQHLERLQV